MGIGKRQALAGRGPHFGKSILIMIQPDNDFSAHQGATDNTLTVFTFWAGNELFGVNISNVLSVSQELGALHKTPIRARGLLGVMKYRDMPVAVYNFAEILGMRSGMEEKKTLIATLKAREQDHLDWLDALEQSLREDVPFTKARDPEQCAFGKWYAQFSTRDSVLAEIMGHLDVPHRRIHALADELLALKRNGEKALALEKLEIERETTLSVLRKHFDYARRQIHETMRPVVLNLTVDGMIPLMGLQIDEVNNVVQYDAASLTGLDAIGLDNELSEMFSGFISQRGENSCLLLSAEKLLDVAARAAMD